MFGEFFLVEAVGQPLSKAERVPLGDTRGRTEAWLRDTLFEHPELIPVKDIEASYGPLLPLCTELRTRAGPIDIAFINPFGRLTLVECKLWRNSEARRKVIAQILDYARAVRTWSYADLQRQVSAATQRQGNVPFETVLQAGTTLQEHEFIDNVSRSIREGRFLLLVAGDGIREEVGGIAELINRNATGSFTFAQIEVALYEFTDGSLAIQPRVLARTQLIERSVVVAAHSTGDILSDGDDEEQSLPGEPSNSKTDVRAAEERWWEPVTQTTFDDPEQEAPKYRWRNHVRAVLPGGLWIAAYRPDGGAGVFVSGPRQLVAETMQVAQRDERLLEDLPAGTSIKPGSDGNPYYSVIRAKSTFANDDEARKWISNSLNQFANAFRPRLKEWLSDRQI